MLDIMTAAPKPVRFGNRTVLLGPLKLNEIGLLYRYIREHGTPPLARVEDELQYAPEEDHRRIRYEAWREQRDNWPPDPRTPAGIRIIFGELEGQRYFLEVLLRKHQEVTDQEIDMILKGIDYVDLSALMTIAFGSDDLDPGEVWAAAKEATRPRPTLPPSASLPPSPDPEDSAAIGESFSPSFT